MQRGVGNVVARQALRQAPSRGRPVSYRQEIADEICRRLSEGESLRRICRDPRMPPNPTVIEWVRDNRGADEVNGRLGFAEQYARARELGTDSIADEVLELGLDGYLGPDGYVDNGEIQRLRLLSDNRKWYLSKTAPKKYGDKVTTEVTGADGGQLITRIELIPVDPRPIIDGSPVEARDQPIEDKRQKR